MSVETVKHTFNESVHVGNKEFRPNVEIMNGDMFTIAKILYRGGNKVCLHNFANNFKPGLYKKTYGGHIYFVTNTQEEQLLRASMDNNQLFLKDEYYPISVNNRNSALYSKNVKFNKNTKTGASIDVDNHYVADVITSAAIKNPKIVVNGAYMYETDRKDTLERLILTVFLAGECDILVTGLWGCGNFNNPVEEIFNLWKEAIEKASASPKRIIFVFPNDFDVRVVTNIML